VVSARDRALLRLSFANSAIQLIGNKCDCTFLILSSCVIKVLLVTLKGMSNPKTVPTIVFVTPKNLDDITASLFLTVVFLCQHGGQLLRNCLCPCAVPTCDVNQKGTHSSGCPAAIGIKLTGGQSPGGNFNAGSGRVRQ
jgi:hypothetical protein